MDIFAKFHKALAQAYPGLRFHIKQGNFKMSGSHKRTPQTAIIEYDRAGVLAQGGHEREMRALLKDILVKHKTHTSIKAIQFQQYIDPKVTARLKAERFATDFKALVLAGASDEELVAKAATVIEV